MIYKVEDTWSKTYVNYVEADSLDEAMQKVENHDLLDEWVEEGEDYFEGRNFFSPDVEEDMEINPDNYGEVDEWYEAYDE